MGDWERGSRRHQRQGGGGGGFYHHRGRGGGGGGGGASNRSSSKYGKEPPPSGSWQQSVPSWEKEFCYHVGLMPWKRIIEIQSLMPLYKNVMDWDSSAAEDAMLAAKARYWAQINGIPFDIPLPNPDMYNDEIDWDTPIDPHLVIDLEKRPPLPPSDEEIDGKSSCLTTGWDSFLANAPIVPTGWVNADDPPAATGWEDWDTKEVSGNNGWGVQIPEDNYWGNKNSSWECRENNSWGNKDNDNSWEQRDNWNNNTDYYYYSEPRRYNKKREGNGSGWNGLRDASARYRGGDKIQPSNIRNCGGRRRNQQNGHTFNIDTSPAPRNWNSFHSCVPSNQQVSGEGGGAWVARCRDKPVS